MERKSYRYNLILIFSLFSIHVFSQPFYFTDTVIKKGQFLPLWEIHFDLASADLQVKPQPQLDSLVDFLIKNRTLKVEIGVHTDFRGEDNANLILSKQRANTLENYLIKKGVEKSRLKAIGFGENKPVIEYEDWKRYKDTHRCGYYKKGNRRVTVVVL